MRISIFALTVFLKMSFICVLMLSNRVAYTKPQSMISPIHPFTLSQSISSKNDEKGFSKNLKIGSINPRVLELATKAQRKAQKLGIAQSPTLTIIDYSLPSTQRRLWVVDMAKKKIIYHTHVAHGSGSGGNQAKVFSDKPGSYQSSLGLFVTGSTYQGKHGLSLKLHGLEKGINGNAERRAIVVHGAHYVSEGIAKQMGRLGRSWGCPALNTKLSTPIIQTIKNGSLVFAYYPDEKWLRNSKFL